ncbi:hypothetical protein Mgra_00005016 [Meloidogyne graminicola]|uniref:Uncharacterized protein n=1 Tax=Meloidogyne graminicola TaxID=189291 RepID=A0A8S9ZRE0_9BILA|nr:hypothetical protein Mgra_00005016 [Meloidogyne graminicola]
MSKSQFLGGHKMKNKWPKILKFLKNFGNSIKIIKPKFKKNKFLAMCPFTFTRHKIVCAVTSPKFPSFCPPYTISPL